MSWPGFKRSLRRWAPRAAAAGVAGLAIDAACRGEKSIAAWIVDKIAGSADEAFVRGARVVQGGMLYRGFGCVDYAHLLVPDAVADPDGYADLAVTWLSPWRRGTEGDGASEWYRDGQFASPAFPDARSSGLVGGTLPGHSCDDSAGFSPASRALQHSSDADRSTVRVDSNDRAGTHRSTREA